MSVEEERIKKIAELREVLEERVKNLESELEGLRVLLDFINNLLLEKSFKRVEEIAKPPEVAPSPPTPPLPAEQRKVTVVPLKTGAGELLANLNIDDGSMRIIPDPDKKFNVNTPPFTAFLVERILVKMQESDQEAARRGEIPSNQILTFNVEKDGDVIREISIRNIAIQRERELRSAIRWTFEKMFEKMKGST